MTSHRVSLIFYLKKSTTLRTMIHRHHNYKKKRITYAAGNLVFDINYDVVFDSIDYLK